MSTAWQVVLLGRPPGTPPDGALAARRLSFGWVVAAAIVGVVCRLLAALQGSNYDMESYWLVAGLVDAGDNVYAATERYNYGPAWFGVLWAIRGVAELFGDPFTAFRLMIAALLILVDVVIAWLLLRRFGPLTAALFLLNPVSILITGYHSQFDNLAIAIGLGAVLLIEGDVRSGSQARDGRWLAGVLLLGVSLVVKHVLVLLPIWLALRQPTAARRIGVLLIPLALLAASFLPFLGNGGADGILANVIGYRSLENPPFHTWWLPPAVQRLVPPFALFVAAVLAVGWLVRRQPPTVQLMVYTVVIVVFAPAMGNQYLAIPAAASVALLNIGYLGYLAVAGVYLAADTSNLGVGWLAEALPGFLVRPETQSLPFGYLVGILGVGLLITLLELRRLNGAEARRPESG